MAKVTAQEAAEKWSRNLRQATQDVERGIQRVSEAPTQKAAQKVDKMRARFLEAVDSGKVERGLNRVTLEEWKRQTLEKGLPRLAQGADAAKDKMSAFMGELLPHIDSGLSQIQRMPDMTIEDSIARASAWIRHMSQFRRGGR